MTKQSVENFIEELSQKSPVPGGGGASALGGALGAALCLMVCRLTEGKKKYACYEEEIQKIISEAIVLKNRLQELILEDAKAFEPLSKAYGLKKDTKEQLEYREKVLEECLVGASEVPLKICECACEVIKLHERLEVIGSRLAISDVGVGIEFAKACLKGGALNVKINTKLMKNRDLAKKFDDSIKKLICEYVPRADAVYEKVYEGLSYENV